MKVSVFIVILFIGFCVSSCAIGEGDSLNHLNKGTFVAWTTGNDVLASDDGIHWRQMGKTAVPISKIVYNGSIFVGGNNMGPTFSVSSDLSNWSVIAPASTGRSYDVVVVDDIFYLTGCTDPGFQQYIFRYDGNDCSPVYNSAVTDFLNSISYGNDRFVAVGFNTAGNNVYSGSESSWTGVDLNYDLYNILFVDGRFIAVGVDGMNAVIISSEDGSNWSANMAPPTFSSMLFSVAYGGGRYVAVGSSNVICFSENGSFWSGHTTGLPSSTLWGIAYGKRAFIAVGISGYIYRSEDGINWETVYSGSVGDFQGVTLIHNYTLDD